MNRRQYLTTVALGMAALAGCTSNQGGGGGSSEDTVVSTQPQSGSSSTRTEETAEPTTETAEQPVVEAVVDSTALRELPEDLPPTLAATGEVSNTGQVYLNAVSAVAKFYDADDQLLTTGTVGVRALAPGESWEPWVQYHGDREQVDSFELAITQALPFNRTVNPSGFAITNSSLEVPAESGSPRVTGTAKRSGDGDPAAILVFPKVYADNGNVLGSGVRSLQQVAAGETIEFDIGIHLWNPEWGSRLTGHDVVLVR